MAIEDLGYGMTDAEVRERRANRARKMEHADTITKVALAHIKDGKLLCVRTEGLELFYNVGGKPEAGESLDQALIRETKEEIGVDIRPKTIRYLKGFVGIGVDKAAGKQVIFLLFAAEFDGTPHIPEEIDPKTGKKKSESAELKWVGPEDKACLPPLGGQAVDWLVANGYM